MADVEVEVAVAVQVGQRRRRGPIPVATQAGAGRDVLEGSVALVAVEGIRPPARDEQVGVAVAVDVAYRDAMAVAAREAADPGGVGHVLESGRRPDCEITDRPSWGTGTRAWRPV